MFIFLIDKDRKPLYPTKRIDLVTKWLRKGQARRITSSGVVQVFKTFKTKPIDHITYSLGIDPGYINIGYCLSKINKITGKIIILVYGTGVINTPNIKKDLETRKMYRKLRRRYRRLRGKRRHKRNGSGIKFRKPRYNNRTNKQRLNPTTRYVVNNHLNLVNKVNFRCKFNELHIEYNKFDLHRLVNPKVFGYKYQHGNKYNLENTKQYVFYRDNYTCQLCKTNKPNTVFNVHHIKPRSSGGSDHHSNLITLCKKCHTKIHNKSNLPNFTVSKDIKLRDASVLNTSMKYILSELIDNNYKIFITYGSVTKDIRHKYNISKEHHYDAMIISLSSCDGLMYDISSVSNNNYITNYTKFKRQDRTVVRAYRDRVYYVNNIDVAHNRRQKCNGSNSANHLCLEKYKKYFKKYKCQFTVKPAIKVTNTKQSDKLYNPGDLVRIKSTGKLIVVKGYSKTGRFIKDINGIRYQFNTITKVVNNTGFVIDRHSAVSRPKG